MSLPVVVALLLATWIAALFLSRRSGEVRELGRFAAKPASLVEDAGRQFTTVLATIAGGKTSPRERELSKKLAEAGLESAEDRGKYLLFKAGSLLVFPAFGLTAYFYMIPYYATITFLFSTILGIGIPVFWLKARATARVEEIRRELPLVLDLTNLGTSAGWDVASSLERVIDVLGTEFPDHPLMRELRRARIVAANGYTWHEALEGLSERLGEDTVRRSALALSQAIRQGGDRSRHLEGIADDAQRTYYSSLDRRLASLPVKALFVTMLLMISYFLLLLAPAAVGVKKALGNGTAVKHGTVERR